MIAKMKVLVSFFVTARDFDYVHVTKGCMPESSQIYISKTLQNHGKYVKCNCIGTLTKELINTCPVYVFI